MHVFIFFVILEVLHFVFIVFLFKIMPTTYACYINIINNNTLEYILCSIIIIIISKMTITKTYALYFIK